MASLQGMEVLLIDDDADIRILGRKILEGDGASFLEAGSAAEGLELARARLPHLIITDLNMPQENGFDFIEKCRAFPETARIPIMVLSARNDKGSVHKAVALGAADYLLKPFRAAQLLQKSKRALNLSSFKAHGFEPKLRPRVDVVVAARMLGASEVGFLVEAPVKIGQGAGVQLEAELVKEMDAGRFLMRATRRSGAFVGPGLYQNEINLIGVDDPAARKIRKVLKGLA